MYKPVEVSMEVDIDHGGIERIELSPFGDPGPNLLIEIKDLGNVYLIDTDEARYLAEEIFKLLPKWECERTRRVAMRGGVRRDQRPERTPEAAETPGKTNRGPAATDPRRRQRCRMKKISYP